MSDLYDYPEYPQPSWSEKAYFSGCNSSAGFINFYGELFLQSELIYTYIIKGGSGTGKSSFMKKCAQIASDAGIKTEAYFCGSDPCSLDGVIFKGNKGSIALLDGTPPHGTDLDYPGAAGRFINLGECWDEYALMEKRDEIIDISKAKSGEYKQAYKYLAAYSELERGYTESIYNIIDKEKMTRAAIRFASTIKAPKGKNIRRFTHGITMRGRAALTQNYSRVINIKDYYGSAVCFTQILSEILSERKIIIHPSPVDTRRIYAISSPEDDMLIKISGDKSETAEKNINMERFFTNEKDKQIKGERKLSMKIQKDSLERAEHHLAKACKYHFRLEDIYKETMDFSRVNNIGDITITQILERLM